MQQESGDRPFTCHTLTHLEHSDNLNRSLVDKKGKKMNAPWQAWTSPASSSSSSW